MIAAIVFTLSLVGFAFLAASMRRTHTVLPTLKPYRDQLQVIGWMGLAASLAVSVAQPRVSVALVEWVGILSVAAIPVVAVLTVYTHLRAPRQKYDVRSSSFGAKNPQ